ncbi:MAG: VCBS repeat-containing protein [Verrucomicrobia subdivision 3 bacterium]|nr:VCBS repeat-containing protein [Limisphaerales bacterium]
MNRIGWIAGLALGLANAGAQQVAWTYVPPAGHVDVSPAFGDVNGDGRNDLVVGTTAGFIVAVDGHGKEIWRHQMRDAVCIPPTIADVTGDGLPDLLAGDRQGEVVCLNGRTGDPVWNTTLPSPPQWGATCLAVGDLHGDGALEIVTGTRDGDVVCLAGVSGDREWIYGGDLGTVMSPAIADLNGDGQPEVLVGTEKVSLVCLSATGQELWRRHEGAGGSPFVYDTGGQGGLRILCGMGKRLHALDAGGNTLWSFPMNREMDSAIAIADADGDGVPEVYATDLSGNVVCVTLSGTLRWTAEVGERSRRSPAIADVDGDGKPEILVASYGNALHVFDPQGQLKVRVPLPGPSNGTPTPVMLDDQLCVVVPAAGAALQVLRWSGSRSDSRVLWAECRCDARRTGAIVPPVKPTRVELAFNVNGSPTGNVRATAVVSNPERHALTVRVEAVRGTGQPRVKRATSSAAHINRSFSYAMPRSGTAKLTVTCQVLDGARTVARRRHTLFLNVFTNELVEISQAIRTAQALVPKLLDARGVEDRACLAATKLEALRPRISGAMPINEADRVRYRKQLAELTAEAKAVLRLASLAEQAAAAGSTLKICAANPWSPFGQFEGLAGGWAASSDLSVFMFGGETECAALNVFNLSSQPRTFRVELGPLAQGEKTVPARDAVALLEVLDVPTERCDMEADALAPLGVASVLQVPAWSGRQLWLNVNSRSLTAGNWNGSIRLRSLEVAPVETTAALSVTVSPARLPEKQALHNCGWGYVHSSMLKDYPAEAIADQVAHGTDVFVGTFFPQARFDATGNLVGEIDYREHDAYVKQHACHGIILFCGYQGALQGPAAADSDAYRQAHVQWLRAWVKHLAELGVGYDGFALYPVDEPGLSQGLVAAYLRLAKLAREADPRIQMYTDPVGQIAEDELRQMLSYVDIWCPNRAGLVLDQKQKAKLDIIKASGKAVWMYECDDNAKHQSPLGYYRAQAWLAWRHQMTGIGFWSYCTSQDDPWFVPRLRYDYLLVYPGNGVVSSKRWEAVRDGIEDYGMLELLSQRLKANNHPAKPDAVAAAKRLLGEQAAQVGGFCTLEDDNALKDAAASANKRTVEDQRWREIQRLRHELARLFDAL